MLVKLHANAALTPAKRAYVRSSGAGAAALARELGVSETTVRRWKGREGTADRSSRPRRLRTRFSAEEEEIVRELRSRLGLSLDGTLEVMRRCVRGDISRSAPHRCVRRLGLPVAAPPEPVARPFEAAPFGHVHADLKHLTRLEGRPAYVFVAVERTTRFAHVEAVRDRAAATVAASAGSASCAPSATRSTPCSPTTARSSPTASAAPAGASAPPAPAATPSTGSAPRTASATS